MVGPAAHARLAAISVMSLWTPVVRMYRRFTVRNRLSVGVIIVFVIVVEDVGARCLTSGAPTYFLFDVLGRFAEPHTFPSLPR